MRRMATCAFLAVLPVFGQPYTISTIAGDGVSGFTSDGITATSSRVSFPRGVAYDSAGNLFIADSQNSRIRRIDAITGIITTVAGNGIFGLSGDGGTATSAKLANPSAVAIDSNGTLYIADTFNCRVRAVSSGTITTVAGTTCGFSRDGSLATSAQLQTVYGLAVDSAGNLYIADASNNRIRMVSGGIISTFAGDGTAGYSDGGGVPTSARLNFPQGVAVDSADNVYIADTFNNRVRKVSGGVISTIAGNGSFTDSGDGGTATAAGMASPQAVAIDAQGNVFIVDLGFGTVRMVSAASQTISTVAGNRSQGYSGDGGPATSAQLFAPSGASVSSNGYVAIADSSNNRVRRLNPGTLTVTINSSPASLSAVVDGLAVSLPRTFSWIPGSSHTVSLPSIQSGGVGTQYVFSSWDDAFGSPSRTIIAPVSGSALYTATFNTQYYLTTTAGNGGTITPASGFVTAGSPVQITAIPNSGNTFAGFTGALTGTLNPQFLAMNQPTTVRATFAGSGGNVQVLIATNPPGLSVTVDGSAIVTPQTLAWAPGSSHTLWAPDLSGTPGTRYLFSNWSDGSANSPRTVIAPAAATIGYTANFTKQCIVSTSAGPGGTISPGTQWFNFGTSLSVTANPNSGYTFTGFTGSLTGTTNPQTLVVLQPATILASFAASGGGGGVSPSTFYITTVGGNGNYAVTGDGGLATQAGMQPRNIAMDGQRNIYIADPTSNRIRKISAQTGIITTVVGNGSSTCLAGACGDGGPATQANLNYPFTVAADSAGNLWIEDSNFGISMVSAVTGNLTKLPGGPWPATLVLALDGQGGLLYTTGGQIWRVPVTGGTATLVAGIPTQGFSGDGGLATSAAFRQPYQVVVDSQGNIYFTDTGNNRIRKIAFDTHFITTVAGGGSGGDGGPAVGASLSFPQGLAVDASGNLYISDSIHYKIRMVLAGTGLISTIAGTGVQDFSGDGGPAVSAKLLGPYNLILDQQGNITFPDYYRIRRLSPAAVNGGGQIVPAIKWVTPGAITYGAALSSAQLNATSPVAGTFAYTPAAGSKPGAGPRTLSVTFTPTDTTTYATAFASVVLQVGPAPLRIAAKALTRLYGGANPSLTYTASGFVNGDTAATALTGTPFLFTTATPFSPVGTYPITISQGSLLSANYTLTFADGVLTVNPAVLTVGTQNATVLYGAPYPAFTPTYSGFVNGETTAILTGAPQITNTAQPGATAGFYRIAVSQGTLAAPNYTFNFVNGTLTISKPTLVITAANLSRPYGSLNPPLTVTYSGFVNGDTAASLSGTPSTVVYAGAGSPVGNYPIGVGQGTLVAPNYTLAFTSGTLTVTPVSLTVMAQDLSRPVASPNPPLSVTYIGFVNGDTAAVMSGVAAYTTTAVPNSPVGTFPIIPSQGSLSARNYTFSNFVPANLTVFPAIPRINWAAPAAIAPGSLLTSTQLNAVATVANGPIPGVLTYSPPTGTVIYAQQTLNVIFTPVDTVNYTTASGFVTLQVTAGRPACVPSVPNLVSWWPGDGAANDIGDGNNATVQGGVSFVAGRVGQAFSLNGSTGSLLVGDPANLRLSGGITINAWIFPRSVPAQIAGPPMAAVLTKWAQDFTDNPFSDSYGLWLMQNGNTVNLFSAIHQTGAQEPQVRGGSVPLNAWSHVAMTYDGTTGQYAIYLNGQIVGSAAVPGGIYVTSHNVPIGSEDSFIVRAFDGLIDEAQVHSRALTLPEIQAIYQAAGTGQCKQ